MKSSAMRPPSDGRVAGYMTRKERQMKEKFIVKVAEDGTVDKIPFKKESSYEQLSEAVGGYLELAPVPPVKHVGSYAIDCFVDEEGAVKIPPRPMNVKISAWAGRTLLGNAVFVGHDGMGETVGLNRADADYIADMFR